MDLHLYCSIEPDLVEDIEEFNQQLIELIERIDGLTVEDIIVDLEGGPIFRSDIHVEEEEEDETDYDYDER